jgi:hypothetical protein
MNANGAAKLLPNTSSSTKIGLYILFILLVLGAAIACIVLAVNSWKARPTPENIKAIGSQQVNELLLRWNGPYGGTKGLTNAAKNIPEDQQLLINMHVRSTRLCGYLGPFSNGVYDGGLGTRLALNSGTRCLIVEIDMDRNEKPVLNYLDETGVRMSLNSASLNSVANHLRDYAFRQGDQGPPADVAGDPFILVLYFVNTPSQAEKPKEYLKFLGECAKQIQPVRNLILGQTPQGDFRRQALESQLFYMPISVIMGKMLILTNVDTSGFRRLASVGLAGQMDDTYDLDFLVHARLYTPQSPSGLGQTTQPLTNVSPAAVITTPYYWMATPPDRITEQQMATKRAWTIAMEPVATELNAPDTETLKKLYEKYGIQSVPFVLFQKEQVTDTFVKGQMKGTAWQPKPELIRFIPPTPIPILKVMPETNARGGAVMAPTFK